MSAVSRLSLTLLTLAGLLFLVGCGESREARVASVDSNQITLAEPTAEPRTLAVPDEAEVTLDGAPVALNRIQPGDAVTVRTVQRDGVATAVEVTATSQRRKGEAPLPGAREESPIERPIPTQNNNIIQTAGGVSQENTDVAPTPVDNEVHISFEGMISQVESKQLVVTDQKQQENTTFMINDQTKVKVNGAEASLENVAVGQQAWVLAHEEDGQLIAASVETKDQP